jgi:diguanylate cyclase (GGDEF)-like protein
MGFEHAAECDVARHPAYGMFKLESYIGIPIYRGPLLYGTLNFSSALPRERKFDEIDMDCLRLMGSWISAELQRRKMEADLETARAGLERLVITDPLTELANRRGMREIFERHAERAGFEGSELSCILVDIDDFKQVNDRFGHSSGDLVIQGIGDAIRASVRPTDIPGRIGGDEFLVVLPGASLAEAERAAHRLAANVRDLRFRHGGEKVAVTVSIGVAKVPAGTTTVTEVLAETQDLLRESKVSGKNAVSVSRKVARF